MQFLIPSNFFAVSVLRKAAEILERDYHCCRVCLSAGIINSNDLSVHHIIPLKDDYDRRLDNDNLITLCRYHHEAAERGHISRQELAAKLEEQGMDVEDGYYSEEHKPIKDITLKEMQELCQNCNRRCSIVLTFKI